MQRVQESLSVSFISTVFTNERLQLFLTSKKKNLLESPQWMPLTFSIIPMKQAITYTRRLDLIAVN